MHSGNICIGGFMCSGKTSVGRELSRRLGWEFLDTDVVIEQRAGMPVPRIFAELGEPVFRRFERPSHDPRRPLETLAPQACTERERRA